MSPGRRAIGDRRGALDEDISDAGVMPVAAMREAMPMHAAAALAAVSMAVAPAAMRALIDDQLAPASASAHRHDRHRRRRGGRRLLMSLRPQQARRVRACNSATNPGRKFLKDTEPG
jgi:hypothetical protein